MPGYFQYYFKIEEELGEHAVCCPFPHKTSTGLPYFETHPSAHVNLEKKTIHCKVCGEGHSEVSFIKETLHMSYGNASKLARAFQNLEDKNEWIRTVPPMQQEEIELCHSLGISDAVIEELCLRSVSKGSIQFPVFYMDKLVDVRTYTPNSRMKIKSRTGALSGLIIPLDELPKTNKTVLLCAGEKDMANARSHGFNAYTITGGENCLPASPLWLKDKDVVILYDNDDAGKLGAHKLASYLYQYCRTVKVCTSFHEVCKENKEDLTDFFLKYKKTREDLIGYMDRTPLYTMEDCIINSNIPMVSLFEATTPKNINRIVRSNIQVAAISESHYAMPTCMTVEKIKNTADDTMATMSAGEMREWTLEDNTVADILHLIDNNFKEADIIANAKMLTKVPKNEKYIRVNKYDRAIVYKAYITEMFESMNTNTMPMEYVAYSIGKRLESGKKYLATYKIVPHPYKGQQLIVIITDVVDANDSVSNFTVTTETIEQLKCIQEIPGTVTEKMHTLIQKVKGLTGYNGNDTLIKVLDLAYHTVLRFNFGTFKDVRGYLDTLIVGESRVGKSSTAETLRTTYQLGTLTSLAGNSATIAGLIGGSNKTVGGAYQTKAGLIPQNHKGLIVFEEFGKCNSNIVSELTDIRSSNEVRITRISGTLALPAMVRMISLSNVKTGKGDIKSIASYPNGIAIVTELVDTAEDIARYDVIAVLSDKGNSMIDPFWTPEEPFPEQVYRTRIRWVWSREPEQIIISNEVARYIMEQANNLNKNYGCHIKIFGTEAWKKLSRLSIAIAGYLVSTDETYTQIVVEREHVDYAVQMFIELYDNTTFRLREYVANERKYNTINEEGVKYLEMMFTKEPALLLTLEQEAVVTKNTLMAAAGLTNDSYNGYMNSLVRGNFVKLSGNDILPTERFRLGMAKINRAGDVRRLGESV